MEPDVPIFEAVEDDIHISDADLRFSLFQASSSEILNAERACKHGQIGRAKSLIKYLLQNGVPARDLQFCLLGAVEVESEDLVEALLSAGVPTSSLVIKPALENGSLRILSLFLKYGWDLNEEEAWCVPPWLSLAVATNADEALTTWFLNNGADPNMSCQMDTTPLSTAVSRAPLSIVRQLFKHCSKTSLFQGQLLHFAARRTDAAGADVLRLVLDYARPNINARMWQDRPLPYECYKLTGLGTALHEAAKYGQATVAEILLQNGADVSIRDSCGSTALEVAEMAGNYPVEEILRFAERQGAEQR